MYSMYHGPSIYATISMSPSACRSSWQQLLDVEDSEMRGTCARLCICMDNSRGLKACVMLEATFWEARYRGGAVDRLRLSLRLIVTPRSRW